MGTIAAVRKIDSNNFLLLVDESPTSGEVFLIHIDRETDDVKVHSVGWSHEPYTD